MIYTIAALVGIVIGLALFLFFLKQINPFPPGYKKPTRKPFPILESKPFTGKSIPCHNPGNGEFLGNDISATPDEVNECVLRAAAAQKDWGKTSFEERSAFLYDLLQVVLENQEEICQLSMRDTGKTINEAYYGEILTTCEKLRHLIAHGKNALLPENRSVPTMLFVKKARVEYYPFGVIGIIIPWNYPFHNAISAISSAVFCGNAAVVKVSEWSTFSRAKFQKLFQETLAKRGYNPDLIQLLPGYGDTGAALCACPDIQKILFIGSPETGKRVMATASQNLTPVILELGGKDPFIILKEAELDHAIEVALRGVFVNQGQNCIAAERVFVESDVYQEVCDKISKVGSKLRVGCPPCNIVIEDSSTMVDCGAMTMPAQVKKVDLLVQDALSKGAVALAGGKPIPTKNEHQLLYPPTILTNLNDSMKIVSEETFGPVMLLFKFEGDDEVIKMANASEFGLGCSIFSKNYKRAEFIAKEIESGMCTINDFGVSYLIQSVPFGGIKKSGFGRFNGVEGLREFSRQKTVVTDRFPMRAKAPRFTSYPIPTKAPIALSNAITMIYSGSFSIKIRCAINFIKTMISMDEPKIE
mmetsp:Transcript_11159/g.19026  ORF Transcript_11159/g.19026 Transcript_11159/m.19026 type:complete len:586 (-) Transcript_11159:43-1800(-)